MEIVWWQLLVLLGAIVLVGLVVIVVNNVNTEEIIDRLNLESEIRKKEKD